MGPGVSKLRRLFTEQIGQDLSEYCLLIAFIVLLATGIFVKVSGGLQSVWTTGNTTLANAATVSGGGGSSSAATR